MVRASDIAGASGTNLMAQNPTTGVVLRDESHRLDPSLSESYRVHWNSRDILLKPFLKFPGRSTTDHPQINIGPKKAGRAERLDDLRLLEVSRCGLTA